MDRKDWYFEQIVTQSEMDSCDASIESSIKETIKDAIGYGFIVTIAHPATVEENDPEDLTVLVNAFKGFDQTGRRLENDLAGFQGGVNLGASLPHEVDLAVDELAADTEVSAPGKEKIISIFIEFERLTSDSRIDGNGATVYFEQKETIKYNIAQGSEADIGTATPVALRSTQLLLCDVTLIFGQTEIQDADIDFSRQQIFVTAQLHGASHVQNGVDPIPNATTSVGGLESAADKTKLDSITWSASGVAALLPCQASPYAPSNVTAPSATTLDVTGAMSGQAAAGSASVEGVVTQSGAPNNRVIIKDTDYDDFVDSEGNKVYGRIVCNNETTPTTWTLSFFTIHESLGETAFDMTPFSGQTIRWWVSRTYRLNNMPTFDKFWTVPSDQVAAEVPDATTTTKGKVQFGTSSDTGASKAVQTNDTRLGTLQAKLAGNLITGTPFSILNFLGGGVTAAASGVGSGQLNVTVNPAPAVQFAIEDLVWADEDIAKSTGVLPFTPRSAIAIGMFYDPDPDAGGGGVNEDVPTMSMGFVIDGPVQCAVAFSGENSGDSNRDQGASSDEAVGAALNRRSDLGSPGGYQANFTYGVPLEVTSFAISGIVVTPGRNITGRMFLLIMS